ncbi:MAG: sulfotransferase [Candidatus Electrothrix sp. AR5]|nr:sulfotransferase [Candidatus Electrothrix sp. AR5]
MNNKYKNMLRKKASCYHETNPEEKSEEFLMNKACREVELYDWGDMRFVASLRRLLNSCREEGHFNSFGWFYLHSLLIKYLCGRLLIQEYFKKHHKVRQEQIRNPLFIISLPRTGTTLLQRLLAQDYANRNLLYWEGLFPAPFPQLSTPETDPRIQAAKEFLQIRNTVVSNINILHSAYVLQPEECFLLLDKSFISPQFHVLFDLPNYYNWVEQQDMTTVYRYYKKQLQILQSRNPRSSLQRWVLKCPFHMFAINSLLEVFPDARIIQIHRSPIQSISSLCSMLTTIRQNLQNKTVTDQLGKDSALIWSGMIGSTILS